MSDPSHFNPTISPEARSAQAPDATHSAALASSAMENPKPAEQSEASGPVKSAMVVTLADHRPAPAAPVVDEDEADDNDDAIDMTEASNKAHAIYGALSTLDLVEITPEEFWAVYGTENLKQSATSWLNKSIKKLTAIKKGREYARS